MTDRGEDERDENGFEWGDDRSDPDDESARNERAGGGIEDESDRRRTAADETRSRESDRATGKAHNARDTQEARDADEAEAEFASERAESAPGTQRDGRIERDPVTRAADGSIDLYGVSTWEQRSRLDWFSARLYGGLVTAARAVVVLLALAILVAQFALGGLAAISSEPVVSAFVLLSVVPAFGLAVYIWHVDATMSEPLSLLVGTFLLGVLFAGFAAVLNTYAQVAFEGIPAVGLVLFFYLVVAPVEETVKLLAVRLYAFRSSKFDAVIDGAVYGAMAGLGFATIENAIYISRGFLTAGAGTDQFLSAGTTALFRTFAGPGHVIYSAFAGYYLGLAKFNREDAGPIVVKGLLIAAFIHATYNTLAGFVPGLLAELLAVPYAAAFIAFVLAYDGLFGYLLYRKLSNYRQLYRHVTETRDEVGDEATVRIDD